MSQRIEIVVITFNIKESFYQLWIHVEVVVRPVAGDAHPRSKLTIEERDSRFFETFVISLIKVIEGEPLKDFCVFIPADDVIVTEEVYLQSFQNQLGLVDVPRYIVEVMSTH